MNGFGSLLWVIIMIIAIIARVSKYSSKSKENHVHLEDIDFSKNQSIQSNPVKKDYTGHYSVAQLPMEILKEAVNDYIKKHEMIVRYAKERMMNPDTIDEYFENYDALSDSYYTLSAIEEQNPFENVSYTQQKEALINNFGENTIKLMDAFWEKIKKEAKYMPSIDDKSNKFEAYFNDFANHMNYMSMPVIEHFETIKKEYKENKDKYLYY